MHSFVHCTGHQALNACNTFLHCGLLCCSRFPCSAINFMYGTTGSKRQVLHCQACLGDCSVYREVQCAVCPDSTHSWQFASGLGCTCIICCLTLLALQKWGPCSHQKSYQGAQQPQRLLDECAGCCGHCSADNAICQRQAPRTHCLMT